MSRILSVYTNGTGLFDHARSVLMRRSYAPNGAVREGCQTFYAVRYFFLRGPLFRGRVRL